MATHEMIRIGAIWKIGRGDQGWRFPPPRAVGLEEATVEASGAASWEEDILGDLFNRRDRTIIKQIPLSLNPIHDQWQWLRDPKGLYTVKSGYHMLQPSQINPRNSMDKVAWNRMWNFRICVSRLK